MTSPATTAVIDQAAATARDYLDRSDVDVHDEHTRRVIRKVNAWYLANYTAAVESGGDVRVAWALAARRCAGPAMCDLRDVARFCEMGADWRDASAHVTPWGVAFTPKNETGLNAAFARACIEAWS